MLCRLRLVVLAGLLLSTLSATPAPQSRSRADKLATLPTEVRVRRLHLVRPDLIQYPISYEVDC